MNPLTKHPSLECKGPARGARLGLALCTLLLASCLQTLPKQQGATERADAPQRRGSETAARRPNPLSESNPRSNAAVRTESASNGSINLGPYSGVPRWGFDTHFAQKIARLQVFIEGDSGTKEQRTGGNPKEALGLFTLNLSRQSTITFRDVLAQQAVPALLLDCEYIRKTATPSEASRSDFRPEYIKIFYWQPGARKGLTPKMVAPYQSRSDQIADMELATCPENFAIALETGFGNVAWERTQAALQERDQSIQSDFAQGRRGKVDYTGWDKPAQALTVAEDRSLAKQVDDALRDLEKRRTNRQLPAEVYYTTLNLTLEPAMAKLAGSGLAQARAIAKGETGRKAFERWDKGVGFTVVSLAMRLHSFKQPGNLFIDVLDRYQQAYATQLADKGALDRTYLKAMLASIEKYKDQEAATASPSIQSNTTAVWVMRPRQSLLYRKINQGVELLQAYSQAKANNEQYLATLDQDIKSTRIAFWSCYDKRCPEGGMLYQRFSALIISRDRWDIHRTAWEGSIAKASNGRFHGVASKLMGMDRQVGTQFIGACDGLYERFLGKFINLSSSPDNVRSRVEEELNGESYLEVQECRDRMEFILRPRSPPAGLL